MIINSYIYKGADIKSEHKEMNYILEYENLQLGDIILESGHKPHSEAIKKFTTNSIICYYAFKRKNISTQNKKWSLAINRC